MLGFVCLLTLNFPVYPVLSRSLSSVVAAYERIHFILSPGFVFLDFLSSVQINTKFMKQKFAFLYTKLKQLM